MKITKFTDIENVFNDKELLASFLRVLSYKDIFSWHETEREIEADCAIVFENSRVFAKSIDYFYKIVVEKCNKSSDCASV